jgi:hypothetical protein
MRGGEPARRLVAAALAVGLAACSAPDAVSSSTSTTIAVVTTTSTVVETTTAAMPETTTTGVETTTTSGGIPYPDTIGDDWFEIVSEIEAFAGWLFENPDPGLVGEIAEPGSAAATVLLGRIEDYVVNGWRDLPDGRVEIREVTVQSVGSTETVVLVVSDFDGATTVDASGAIVEEKTDTTPFLHVWYLSLQPDGAWLVTGLEPIGPAVGVED